MNLGIQSYSLRHIKDFSQLFGTIKELGFSEIELYPGHCAHDSTSEFHDQIATQCSKTGLRLSSYGLAIFNTDESNTRKIFEFAKRFGIKGITGDIYDGALEIAQRCAEEYNITIALHNHGTKHRLGTQEKMDAFLANCSEIIGVCLDTGWCLEAGLDPVAMYKHYKGRVFGMHLKDFHLQSDGTVRDAILGSGKLDLKKIITTLKEDRYSGYLSVEYEANVADPVADLRQSAANVKALL